MNSYKYCISDIKMYLTSIFYIDFSVKHSGTDRERGALHEALNLTWMASISTRRVVQNDNTGQVIVYYRQVFNITT